MILDITAHSIGNASENYLLQNTASIKGISGNKDSYLLDLEQQITETRDRRKRETQENQDWWEKRKEPQFTVKMPTKPHPSQVSQKKILCYKARNICQKYGKIIVVNIHRIQAIYIKFDLFYEIVWPEVNRPALVHIYLSLKVR